MREIIAGKGIKPGARLDEYILSVFPALSRNALYKAFRKKDIKIDGRWSAPDARLTPNDVISIYLSDELLFGCHISQADRPVTQPGTKKSDGYFDGAEPHIQTAPDREAVIFSADTRFGFAVAYEDERVLIANKPQGLPVHPDRNGRGMTLIELVNEYLGAPPTPGQPPYLCHRLDRNTGGLVAIAKDREALDIMLKCFSSGGAEKRYRCIVAGRPEPPEATICAYLSKDAARGNVTVYDPHTAAGYGSMQSGEKASRYGKGALHTPPYFDNTQYFGKPPGARIIATRYNTISYDQKSDTSKLEASLLTGRTHQIRAHFASIGHPVVGDGKYCPNEINRRFRARYQMLIAYRLDFPDLPSIRLSGKTIEIPDNLSHPVSFTT